MPAVGQHFCCLSVHTSEQGEAGCRRTRTLAPALPGPGAPQRGEERGSEKLLLLIPTARLLEDGPYSSHSPMDGVQGTRGIPLPCPTHSRRQELQTASVHWPANASPQWPHPAPKRVVLAGTQGRWEGCTESRKEFQLHQLEPTQQSRGQPGRGVGGGGVCHCVLSRGGQLAVTLHPVSEPGDTLAGPLPWGPSRCWFPVLLHLSLW